MPGTESAHNEPRHHLSVCLTVIMLGPRIFCTNTGYSYYPPPPSPPSHPLSLCLKPYFPVSRQELIQKSKPRSVDRHVCWEKLPQSDPINHQWCRGGMVLKHREAGALGRDKEAHLAANNVDLFLSRIGMWASAMCLNVHRQTHECWGQRSNAKGSIPLLCHFEFGSCEGRIDDVEAL